MLVIISDLHLTDGTSGETIGPRAFRIFRERLCDLAYDASWRVDGKYKPIPQLDLVLLGDILDVIRSSRWLEGKVRPWDGNPNTPAFKKCVRAINQGILEHNADSLEILKSLQSDKTVTIPAATKADTPRTVGHEPGADGRVRVAVNTRYLVGNHDWFYHLPGTAYNKIRHSVVEAIGLANSPDEPFPHDPGESEVLRHLYEEHEVFARHGDIYDPFNYEGDRDASSLGDAIVVQLLNRFPTAVQDAIGGELPPDLLTGLKEIDNVRPLLLIPAWIDGLLRRLCPDRKQAKQVKQIWDELVDEFLGLAFVRERDSFFRLNDLVDQLEWAMKLSKGLSLRGLSRVVTWCNELLGDGNGPFYKHAMSERAYKNRTARYIVYGHTHRQEIVPLDSVYVSTGQRDQMYLNSGTWRRVHELARHDPKEEEFIDYYVMTYLAFFKDDERNGQRFESWSGALGGASAAVGG